MTTRTISNQLIRSEDDYTGNLSIKERRYVDCCFDDCILSCVKDPRNRSSVTDVTLLNCTVRDGKLGPAILERVVVDGLSTFDLFIVWGTLFRNVVLKGRLGRVKINQAVAAFVDDAVQRAFDEDREAFYAQTDWAIDIREAEFTEFDCRGIPARLFLRDPESQAVVTRERALGSDWREQVSSSNTFWPFVIDEMFLESGDNDTILVAPRGARRKEYQKLLRDLNELRALGVVEPD